MLVSPLKNGNEKYLPLTSRCRDWDKTIKKSSASESPPPQPQLNELTPCCTHSVQTRQKATKEQELHAAGFRTALGTQALNQCQLGPLPSLTSDRSPSFKQEQLCSDSSIQAQVAAGPGSTARPRPGGPRGQDTQSPPGSFACPPRWRLGRWGLR